MKPLYNSDLIENHIETYQYGHFSRSITNNCTNMYNYDERNFLNKRALDLINEFEKLEDNWDEEGSPAPSKKSVRLAETLVNQMQSMGQKVYHVAPGTRGEVMLDLREKEKSVEIIFYPDKKIYVLFPKNGQPKQGVFDYENLSEILTWLHEK